ncbi:TPA: hypothetical protein ACMEXA_005643 [Klebsiella variicola subsp. variicola]|jgi:uncharacterized small protein (DUF1192 family)|uniref:hypothetical protein n=1 Tax=Klebsiella variicola TaxID=244366 RepID=UPI001CC9D00A|nr:hypothetical protein [Klebsiella variicola]HBQ8857499.1 hypothetical protein [Klebsiella variicola subsp. variicola]HBQ8869340.1 hypothetical protein [Klebsiella pneumoniae]MEC5999699.1 hypothetical protein [Klebsiella variicola]UBN00575.1 hypothetical protein LB484_29370 [Klebsiella variicola]HBQ8863807.1 hypothetical protein [Klebsiella variicola subsp. variicola]
MSEKTTERIVIDQLLKLKSNNERELVRRIDVLQTENDILKNEINKKDQYIFSLEYKLECETKEKEWILSDIYHIRDIMKEGD